MRSLLLALALLVSLVVAIPSGPAATPTRDSVANCFESRRVLVDPGAAVYLPASIAPRSRQLALSFVLVPDTVVPGVAAVVVISPTRKAAAAAHERIRAFVRVNGRGTVRPAALRRLVQRRGATVVVWLTDSRASAGRVATACLGPVTA
jgi:hypothetical protein